MGTEKKIMGQDKKITIIDYGMGNVRSAGKAFLMLADEVVISGKKEDIEKSDFLVLPGVGAFGEAMENLKKLKLIEVLNREVIEKRKPILGICLGMQLMARDSEEFGYHQGLGWIGGSVKLFSSPNQKIKVPHVGWNSVNFLIGCPLFKNIRQGTDFYFVHSYHFVCDSPENIAATCDYGIKFTAAIQKDNIFATQFHPEKSQKVGLKILENFLNFKNA